MEVRKKGQISMPGDLNVKNTISSQKVETSSVSTSSIKVDDTIHSSKIESNELVVKQNTIIEGDLIIRGKIEGLKLEEPKVVQPIQKLDEVEDGVLYIGKKNTPNSWRLRIEGDQLYFDKHEEGEYSVRQSIL